MAAENFFSRWSQRKQQGDDGGASDEQLAHASDQETTAPQKVVQMTPAVAPELTAADVGKLTLESDYAVFMGKEVDASIRRSAMKKLFFNPQLSVMDGLDIYISDYNKTTPIPAAMLSALEQAKSFLIPADEPPSPSPQSLNTEDPEGVEREADPEQAEGAANADMDEKKLESPEASAPSTLSPSEPAAAVAEQEQSSTSQSLTEPRSRAKDVQSQEFTSSDGYLPCDSADSPAVRKGQNT